RSIIGRSTTTSWSTPTSISRWRRCARSSPPSALGARGFRASRASCKRCSLRFSRECAGDAAELGDIEFLGAGGRRDAEANEQCFAVLSDLAERGTQHLAPLAEGSASNPLQLLDLAPRLGLCLRHELDHRGIDF